MKKFIVIALVLLFAVPAMADYRTDRADLLASAGLFNVAVLDNPVYAEQAKNMAADTSRGRVTIRGRTNFSGKGENVNMSYDGSVDHNMLNKYRLTGTATDENYITSYTFYYNNGTLTSTTVKDNSHGYNRPTTYSGSTGVSVYNGGSRSPR